MVDDINLRTKLIALGALPVVVLVVVAGTALSTGSPAAASLALAGAVPVLALSALNARIVGGRVDALLDRAVALAPDDVTAATGPADGLARLDDALGVVERRVAALTEPPLATDEISTGEIVAGLAERIRDLMDRQLTHIDFLEATEQDPARLEQVFELDHLAYRMRRATESMAIAGGAEPTAYQGGPTPITDVLRVAIGAVETYRNVRLVAVDDVLVAGQSGFELAQLIAELVDNATRFSLDDVPVEVVASGLDNGDYRITVIDHGMGMDDRLLDTTNQVVADPPNLDEGVGDSIGLVVVGRLARRIGAMVELSATPDSGVTAQVIVPSTIIVADVPGRTPATAEARTAKRERRRRVSRRSRSSQPQGAGGTRERGDSEQRQPAATPASPGPPQSTLAKLIGTETGTGRDQSSASLEEAVPTGQAFETGVEGLLAESSGPDPSASTWTPPLPAPAAGAAELGLVRRPRGAGRIPTTLSRPARASSRPPDEIRSMITRYRDGLKGPQEEPDQGPEGPAGGGS